MGDPPKTTGSSFPKNEPPKTTGSSFHENEPHSDLIIGGEASQYGMTERSNPQPPLHVLPLFPQGNVNNEMTNSAVPQYGMTVASNPQPLSLFPEGNVNNEMTNSAVQDYLATDGTNPRRSSLPPLHQLSRQNAPSHHQNGLQDEMVSHGHQRASIVRGNFTAEVQPIIQESAISSTNVRADMIPYHHHHGQPLGRSLLAGQHQGNYRAVPYSHAREGTNPQRFLPRPQQPLSTQTARAVPSHGPNDVSDPQRFLPRPQHPRAVPSHGPNDSPHGNRPEQNQSAQAFVPRPIQSTSVSNPRGGLRVARQTLRASTPLKTSKNVAPYDKVKNKHVGPSTVAQIGCRSTALRQSANSIQPLPITAIENCQLCGKVLRSNAPGEMLHVLPCGHKFHFICVLMNSLRCIICANKKSKLGPGT